MKDFRTDIINERCWDFEVQKIFENTNVPSVDCILQNREELIAFLDWIRENNISSYLEIGIWTGRLISTLVRLFNFEKIAACDLLQANDYGLNVDIPAEVDLFVGNSHSASFLKWRKHLGEIDLIFIDASHTYESVSKDFEINRSFPHSYIAFHDIIGYNSNTSGVGHFWRDLSFGTKIEIIRPHKEIGLNVSTMGIGIWKGW
jgi:hypothetical protein